MLTQPTHLAQRRIGLLRLQLKSALLLFLLPLLCSPVGFTRWAQAQPAKSPPKFALLVGINNYPDERDKLKGCVNDVTEMKKMLVANFGFAEENVVTLTDAQATRDAIINHFRSDLRDKAEKNRDAVVLFYFSGHGQEIPDNDGDEARYGDPTDKMDESLCAIDTNLRDDDVNVLYRELVPYTQNASFILDACHSGTGTRAPDAADGPHIKEKVEPFVLTEATPLNITDKTGGGNNTQGVVPALAKTDDDDLPRTGNWIQISGCSPLESSVDDSFNGAAQGTLTYYLLQAMERATSRTTNGQIWQETARGVSGRRPTQHPQMEGTSRAAFLGGSTRLEAPPMRYSVEGDKIIVNAGLNQGAKVGGYVALKSTGADAPVRLSISETTATRATLDIPEGTTLANTGEAQLLTPYYGIEAVTVRLNKEMEAPVVAALKKQLTDPDSPINLLRVVDGEEKAQLEVCYGPRGDVDKSKTGEKAKEMVYYVKDGDQILYNAFFSTKPDLLGEQTSVPVSLQKTLENYVQQRNLQTLSNNGSDLNGKIVVSLLRVPNKAANLDQFRADESHPFTPIENNNETYQIGKNDNTAYLIQLKNNGKQPLYASIVGIYNDGSIVLICDLYDDSKKNFSLASVDDEKNSVASSAYCIPGPPYGLDSYKVLVSAQATDWSWLEREAVYQKSIDKARIGTTPFEALLKTTSAGQARSAPQVPAASTLDFSSWGTLDFQVEVK